MSWKLVIVQDKPTQFDAPLYDALHRGGKIGLKVFYTEAGVGVVDAELGRAPQWDHLGSCVYPRRDLLPDEAANTRAVAAEITAEEPDLVILCGYYPRLHAHLARRLRRMGIRIGLRSDSTLEHSDFSGVKGLVKKVALPRWLREYNSWHPVGTLARRYLQTVAGTDRPTFLFPYNVDNAWFAREAAPHRAKRGRGLTELGFAEGVFVVLGVMKWHPREDPLTLLDAFARLRARHPSARLVLVGDGPLRDEVRVRAAQLPAGSVVLPGFVPYSELPRLYASADVFVHPAVNEPWGVSVNEAMACGLPVVAAEGVGSRVDLVESSVNGFVFPNSDADALAARLGELMDNPQQAGLMGQASVARIAPWSYAQSLREMERAVGA